MQSTAPASGKPAYLQSSADLKLLQGSQYPLVPSSKLQKASPSTSQPHGVGSKVERLEELIIMCIITAVITIGDIMNQYSIVTAISGLSLVLCESSQKSNENDISQFHD